MIRSTIAAGALRSALAALALTGAAGTPAMTAPKAGTEVGPGRGCPAASPVETRHVMRLAGRPLAYVARVGLLPVGGGEGPAHGCMFYVAYSAQARGRAPRPVTFVWNGGPGASASYLHLEAFGPRRIASPPTPMQPAPRPLRLEDNAATLLDQSDLVFVDPIGTGYSRPGPGVASGGTANGGAEFYDTQVDAQAATEFVRGWRDRFATPGAPLVLAGESYGVWRAASVAQRLEEAGVRVAGTVLISGGVPVGPVLAPTLKAALLIPNRTAAAHYYGKLPAPLQADFGKATGESERWARDVYAPALARAESLTPAERSAVIDGLARYTGLERGAIDARTLVVPRRLIGTELAKDRGVTLGVLDVRVPGAEPAAPERQALITSYLRNDLGYVSAAPYVELDAAIGEGWSYSLPAGASPPTPPDKALHPEAAAAFAAAMDGPPGGSRPWLQRAAALDPKLKVFIAAGWYDLLNSCAGNAYLASHLWAPLGPNMTQVCYRAGHMVYRDRDARLAFRADLRRFYAEATR